MTKQEAEPGSNRKGENGSNNWAKQRNRASNQSIRADVIRMGLNLRGVDNRRRGRGTAGGQTVR